MKVTYRGDYALKTVLDLAVNYDKGLSTTSDIASRIDAPVKFLEQILLDLKKGGFVESRRGSVGGYFLARQAGKISLGEVIRFIDGPVEPIACVEESYSSCTDISRCVFKGVWHRVSRATSDIIDNITFQDLVDQVNTKQKTLTYSI
jgi:Rrf2 family protein